MVKRYISEMLLKGVFWSLQGWEASKRSTKRTNHEQGAHDTTANIELTCFGFRLEVGVFVQEVVLLRLCMFTSVCYAKFHVCIFVYVCVFVFVYEYACVDVSIQTYVVSLGSPHRLRVIGRSPKGSRSSVYAPPTGPLPGKRENKCWWW
jgi:hypothetical protein